MRTLLNLAHCHGAVLGTSWQLVLATLQVRHPFGDHSCIASSPFLKLLTVFLKHLVWILGLKPGMGGALKPGRAVEGPSTVSNVTRLSLIIDFCYWCRQENANRCV